MDRLLSPFILLCSIAALLAFYLAASLYSAFSSAYRAFAKKVAVPPDEVWVGSNPFQSDTFYPGEKIAPSTYKQVCKFQRHVHYSSDIMLFMGIGIRISFSIEVVKPTIAATDASSTDELIDIIMGIYKHKLAIDITTLGEKAVSKQQRKFLLQERSETILCEAANLLGLEINDIQCHIILRK